MPDLNFQFYLPCRLLRPFVKYYWVLQTDVMANVLTFPIGCPMIIFHKRSPLFIPELNVRQEPFTISGQVNFPSHLQPYGNLEMIVVVFHPQALTFLIGTPLSEIHNQEICGYDLADRNLHRLADSVFDTPDTTGCIHLIESWLTSRLPSESQSLNLHRIGYSIERLCSDTSIRVSAMAEAACLSKKQFERIFLSTIGMKPKEYSRIVRFQKALWHLQHGNRDFCGIANDCGYSDQSHLIRDFKTYSGLTPETLLRTQKPYSELFTCPFSSIH